MTVRYRDVLINCRVQGLPTVLHALTCGPPRAKLPTMRNTTPETSGFTTGERAYIRGELDQFMSSLPTVAEGFMLKTWRGGPNAGQPKLPVSAQGLVERGLMRLDPAARPPRLFFTKTGLAALREMMSDGRFADPRKFAHVRQELGVEPRPDEQAG